VLDQIFGGELPTAVRFVIAFGVVLSLIALTFVGLRRFAGRRLPLSNGAGRARQPRLGVLDAFAIDARRRLVLIRRDNVEHLIMIGGPNDVLVESEIVRAPAQAALAPQRNQPQQRPGEPARAPAAPQAQAPQIPTPQIPAPQRPLLVPEQAPASPAPEQPEPPQRAPGFRAAFQRPAPAAVTTAPPSKVPERPQAARPPAREQQPQLQVQHAEDGPAPAAKPKVEIDPLYADIEKKLGEALARPQSPQPQRAAPPPPSRSAPPPPARRAPEPAAAPPPPAAASTPKSHLDALEEEMASLLGRDRS
jgi:flagellar protein FliO/FliZ